MSGTENVFQERRSASLNLIRELVDVRSSVLSLYGDLAANHSNGDDQDVIDMLENFCQALIDYTADAHFRLYRYIDEKKERRHQVVAVADKVYPDIVTTTQKILDFNEKYDFDGQEPDLGDLKTDLSLLGECLADRIELEDQVINAMKQGRR
ncbi:MAG TPA: Rsd/AlgQ family anti-sigma factor [Gammaproteobacteria bacterium]|nr:Rsd/AlgQ family anti-sigma factor [Gammaproteobacteria bacterium]